MESIEHPGRGKILQRACSVLSTPATECRKQRGHVSDFRSELFRTYFVVVDSLEHNAPPGGADGTNRFRSGCAADIK